uniref:Uncharacterized protein LOC105055000 n=1 Tax=Elaeis guineensis var. tenera TaxID=51953 RepID=A0A8N4F9U2_ELAGV|nr:uncharacterized protein LOC105055000 [Elaeis guineensis]
MNFGFSRSAESLAGRESAVPRDRGEPPVACVYTVCDESRDLQIPNSEKPLNSKLFGYHGDMEERDRINQRIKLCRSWFPTQARMIKYRSSSR